MPRGGTRPSSGQLQARRILLFLSCCLLICAGSVFFAKQIPPLLGTLAAGFVVGSLFWVARQQILFQRHWPLFESIIDWKLVDRLRGRPDDFG